MSLLKTGTATAAGQEFEIVEMSGKAQIELLEAQDAERPSLHLMAIVCLHCVPSWECETVDEVLAYTSGAVIMELATQAFDLSGIEEDSKN